MRSVLAAVAVLALGGWGALELQSRSHPLVATPELALSAYEDGRPSAEAACRFGDDRFIAEGA